MWSMSQANAHYLLGFVLDVFFAVGSKVVYRMALDTKDRFLARLGAISFALSCVGAAFCFAGLVF
jgi:hypothetical protein